MTGNKAKTDRKKQLFSVVFIGINLPFMIFSLISLFNIVEGFIFGNIIPREFVSKFFGLSMIIALLVFILADVLSSLNYGEGAIEDRSSVRLISWAVIIVFSFFQHDKIFLLTALVIVLLDAVFSEVILQEKK